MAVFTRPNGSSITVAAKDIVRFRPSFTWENDGHIGTTLFKPMQLVQENVASVGAALQAEVPSFMMLLGIKNRPLWFDAKKASDARTPRPSESGNGVQAIIPVGGIGMRVLADVPTAQAAIIAARAAV